MEWIANFKRAHLRDPTKTDMEVIKDQIDEFNFYNKKYILLKAKMIRQGLIQPKFDIQEPEASTTDKGAALQRRMTMTGMKFNAGGGGNFTSSKGFGALANAINGTETFFADPSLKKLKEDISMKEVQNQQLEDEIARLRYMLQDNVGENDIVLGLQKELDIKENYMKERDDEINNLIQEKLDIENEKLALKK